jgi:antitoxin component YwqK of YwqJK toxin-antitoxin module
MKFEQFNSIELPIIKDVFNSFTNIEMDVNMAYIVESYIYKKIKEYKDDIMNEYTIRFDEGIEGEFIQYYTKPLSTTENVVAMKVNYSKNEREDEYNKWYKNGQLWETCYYSKNKREGEYKRYYPNGDISGRSFYKDDKLHGPFISLFSNNNKYIECCFHEGKYIGYFTRWHITLTNGIQNKAVEGFFLEGGILNGEYKEWNISGELICHKVYNNGEIIETIVDVVL